MAIVRVHTNPFHRTMGVRQHRVPGRRRVRALAPKIKQPYICLLNGQPLLRAGWNRRTHADDVVQFVLLPQGGGDSNPLRILAMIAVMWFAGWAVGPTGLFGPGGLTGIQGIIVKAGIGLLGSALINAIIPPEPPPVSAQANLNASPTYSLGAQGNQARLGDVIPPHYGRMMVYPDFAAKPYLEYAGQEQYLYQLFCIGLGEYDIEQVRIEDSPISSFEEVEMQIAPPGSAVTLFPYNVATSDEVAGQELVKDTYIGPFVANAAGTLANQIAFDIVCPKGLYYANDEGGLSSRTLQVKLEARRVDDMGEPLGDWQVLGTPSITDSTATPLRFSYRYSVTPGRYEARATRLDEKNTSSRAAHEVVWGGLRAYLTGNAVIPGVTLLAVKMRASNNLSNTASRKINVIATRKLKTWHPTTGWSATTTATRSMVWALADVFKNTDYGARLPDARLDLQGFYALDQVLTERGHTFDGRFDSQGNVWEVARQICKACRSRPFQQSGIVRVVRDQAQEVPSAMFTMRNIVRGSFKVEYIMPTEDMADAIDVEYFDGTYWRWETVRAKLAGSGEQNVVKYRLFGVTSRQQAWEEGMYMLGDSTYRRRIARLTTEKDGFIPTFGDLCIIAHDMPGWGQSGAVKAWDAETLTLTLSEPVTFGAGTHYIGLRRPNGTVAGPYIATEGGTEFDVVIDEAPDFTLIVDQLPDREPTHYAFGAGETWRLPVRALSVRPRGLDRVELEFVVEDPAVHLVDTGEAPAATAYSQLPTTATRPVVTGLIARSMPDAVERAVLSWQPAPGAEYYLVEQSASGDNWLRMGEPSVPNFSCTALYASATIFRVAAYGSGGVGPWVVVGYAAGAGYMWSPADTDLMWDADPDTLMWSV